MYQFLGRLPQHAGVGSVSRQLWLCLAAWPVFSIAGCSSQPSTKVDPDRPTGNLVVYAVNYPLAYLADRIGGESIEGTVFLIQGTPWLLLFVLFLMGTQSAVFGPAKYGILPEMVRARDLPRFNGIIQMTTFLSIIESICQTTSRCNGNRCELSLTRDITDCKNTWYISLLIFINGYITPSIGCYTRLVQAQIIAGR